MPMPTRYLLALFVALASSGGVRACSCTTTGEPGACGKLAPTEVVFVGTVLSIENPPYEVSTENPGVQESRYRFRIDEMISGLGEEQEIDIYSGRGGGDCSYHFVKNQKYLVFPNRNKDRLVVTICSRTRHFNFAQAILPQLRAMRDGNPVASVYGLLQIGQQPYLSVTDDVPPQPLRNTRIELRDGDRVFATDTDSEGAFFIYSISPGVYSPWAKLPPNTEFALQMSNRTPPPSRWFRARVRNTTLWDYQRLSSRAGCLTKTAGL
jgi:hypothetical protein